MFSKADGNSSIKGACDEGTPRAEERDEEQHNNTTNLRKRTIMLDLDE